MKIVRPLLILLILGGAEDEQDEEPAYDLHVKQLYKTVV